MSASILTHIAQQPLALLAQKAMHIPQQATLVISDVHLGKAAHFRKQGIAIPHQADETNFTKLAQVIQHTKPETILFLGDLFHSEHNHAWEQFVLFRKQYLTIAFELVIGNHDILNADDYTKAGITVVGKTKEVGDILFTHEPIETVPAGKYNIAGHVHPKVKLRGRGYQAAVLPCFYFGKSQGLLPAFGTFTGGYKIQPKKGDQVFAIAEDTVVALH